MKRKTSEIFISEAIEIFNSTYNYDCVEYVNTKTKVKIKCNKHGTYFNQLPNDHIRGLLGCVTCQQIQRSESRKGKSLLSTSAKEDRLTRYLDTAARIHGNYTYHQFVYKNSTTKSTIHCPIHGNFQQSMFDHTNRGYGCPKCNTSIAEFIHRAADIHNSKYTYNKVDFNKLSDSITITCPKHGDWSVRATHHISLETGCPKCATTISKGEQSIADFISSLGIHIEQQNKTIIKPLHLDILLPELNIAIEFNGSYWHSDKFKHKQYHAEKTQKCHAADIRLIHIYDYEWSDKQHIVESRLRSILSTTPTVYARKCNIVDLSTTQRREFFNNNHIQGDVGSSRCYGLMCEDELVAAMSFGKPRFSPHEWELLRFANKCNITVVGGASRLFKHFIKHDNPHSVISYSDNRWNSGSVYQNLDFKLSHTSDPNYFYSNGKVRLSRYQTQKHKLHKLLPEFDTLLSERENMNNWGYYRTWDCGNKVFVWNTDKYTK